MLTLEGLIAVLSFGLTCFGLGRSFVLFHISRPHLQLKNNPRSMSVYIILLQNLQTMINAASYMLILRVLARPLPISITKIVPYMSNLLKKSSFSAYKPSKRPIRTTGNSLL